MEVLSMLRYWRGGAAGSGGGGSCSAGKDANANPGSSSSSGHTTITTSAFLPSSYDEGPFFDLHLAVPDAAAAAAEGEIDSNFEEEEEDARESIKSVEFSAADGEEEVVFKGRLVPIDSIDENSTHLAGPLVKSNTKLSVFFLGLKKPATSIGSILKGSDDAAAEGTSLTKEKSQNHRFFTVKFKGEEVRLVSFFTRENSRNGSKQNKDSSEDGSSPATESGTAGGISGEVKGKSKVTVQKYLNAIKPLYEKVAKKNGDNYKVGFSGNLNAGGQGKGRCTTGSQDSVPSGPARQGSFPSGLKVVYKHFGKSRSASWPASTAGSSSSSSAAAASAAGSGLQAQRRDDSLLQQQDGIQSAIAHCKQSFSSITDSGSAEEGLRSHHG